MVADGIQSLQVVLEVGDEFRPEVSGGQFFGLVLFQQPLDAFLIVSSSSSKTLPMCFLLMKTCPLLELRNDALVSVNETSQRGQKRSETAFEPLHRQDLHELRKVALTLDFLFVTLAGVVGKRRVAERI